MLHYLAGFFTKRLSRILQQESDRSQNNAQGESPVEGLVKIPQHVAIIMDGNGRWALSKGLPRTAGHQEGVNRLREIVSTSGRLGIKILTLYVFSTENWTRPQEEVSFLMNLLMEALEIEVDKMHKNGVKVRFIGARDRLAPEIFLAMERSEKKTEKNQGLILNLAIDYGGRSEMIAAMKAVGEGLISGSIEPAQINEDLINRRLYTAGQPDPDLIIRTGGEKRISNFLLWQAAYSELLFTDLPWPEFTEIEFHRSLMEYQQRERRFGGLK